MRYPHIAVVFAILCALAKAGEAAVVTNTIETDYFSYKFGSDGVNCAFVDKGTSTDYGNAGYFAVLRESSTTRNSSSVVGTNGGYHVNFSGTTISLHLATNLHSHYLEFSIVAISDTNINYVEFANIPLTLTGGTNETFAACGLSLNLGCHFLTMPRPSPNITAYAYPVGGITGARAAIIGCPSGSLRTVLQEVVAGATNLPHLTSCGPWATDTTMNHRSGVHNWGNLTTTNASAWLNLATNMGIAQIDWIETFMRGDYEPLASLYPGGKDDVSNVVKTLKAAGISSGLHTYSFRIDHDSTFTHPVPDTGLLKDATFTLAETANATTNIIYVTATPASLANSNGVILQIENELVEYTALKTDAPYGFTGCTRGAHGTTAASHTAPVSVYHMAEDSQPTFKPDPRTPLLTNIAIAISDTVNYCGFDTLYFDGMGGDGLLDAADGWHWNALLAYEVARRLERPTLIEMSVMSHELWCVRSRMGAWDSPTRGHKAYTDVHALVNSTNTQLSLPLSLGWTALKYWSTYGLAGEPTFPDDVEYLCCKALANDSSCFWQGAATPDDFTNGLAWQRIADVSRNWETLRASAYVPPAIKETLKTAGIEFGLTNNGAGHWSIYRVSHAEHKVECGTNQTEGWSVTNAYAAQPLKCRIEVLMSGELYDSASNTTVVDFDDPTIFTDQSAVTNVYWSFTNSTTQQIGSYQSGYLWASNALSTRSNTWVKVGTTLSPVVNLDNHECMGVWVYGDGKGEVLNVQLLSSGSTAIADHYAIIDFTGWKYFQLIEPEGERRARYSWPYAGTSQYKPDYIYNIDLTYVSTLNLYLNNLPAQTNIALYLSPIQGLPLRLAKMTNLSLTIGGTTLTFQTNLQAGYYMEFTSASDCRVYEPWGDLPNYATVSGSVPTLATGSNYLTFACNYPGQYAPRVAVTVDVVGDRIWDWPSAGEIRATSARVGTLRGP